MSTHKIAYSDDTAITFDVSSLTASPTFVLGRESTQIDNTTNLFLDAQVYCDGIAGHASTLPVVGAQIQLYVWGSTVSLGTVPINDLDGADAERTLTHVAVLNSLRLVAAPTVTVNTAALVYTILPFSVASFFGGVLPPFWGLFLAHNHAGTLGAAQSGIWSYRGITGTTTA